MIQFDDGGGSHASDVTLVSYQMWGGSSKGKVEEHVISSCRCSSTVTSAFELMGKSNPLPQDTGSL